MKIPDIMASYNFTDKNSETRIKYIVIHYVGALGSAKENCQYYASCYMGASSHYFVGFDGVIWQSVEDADYRVRKRAEYGQTYYDRYA